ncbi:MAG TPA: UDP-2,3-diacylglucosamine diphosphatase [Desulfurivibrio alkaliphilus]|uniref:UDP-2,3-diacylglucosamine diphosphatase n=1 Tax=Desulfurivibrio alkaliphilus TaxID=427923 RepID=A0A7C2X9Q2_9BACT|nr:UDP-2,3-diacylglucosamine diphosphatase [Desulfurivibrio alkaliphilus]
MQQHTFRTIWLSDTHLGSRGADGEALCRFLERTESQYLYLVGDIIDLWKVRRGWHWPAVNDRIVELILAKAGNGTMVFYIPGNHDGALRDYVGGSIGGVELRADAVHETAAGLRLLVKHGDEFDCVTNNRPWLARLGGYAYDYLFCLNRFYNGGRRLLGLEYRSLSAWLKNLAKRAVNFVGRFEETVLAEIRRRRVSGLICGHVHHAVIKEMGGFFYGNIGDWVESNTALTENRAGDLALVRWTAAGLQPLPVTAAVSVKAPAGGLPGQGPGAVSAVRPVAAREVSSGLAPALD